MQINGQAIDGIAGTRTWSQYDKRTIYGVYDVADVLTAGGNNAVGVYAGRGWYGHWGYGNPTCRVLLSVTIEGMGKTLIGSSTSWTWSVGPVTDDDEYNGEVYNATMETPGWTLPGFAPALPWQLVSDAANTSGFKLKNASLDSMSFPPIDVMHTFTAKWWKEPSPGVYVFDFEQNLSGWILLKMLFCRAGLVITFRHAELLQHPPYGPKDGNIYVGNLRGAKATDTYICKGDPNGEEWQPTFTQHGFRYVEVTGLEEPPTLDMITAINIRSSVEEIGTISFSDPMMNNVQHNLLWGQATNLMMVPTDCDQRDERLGWTGDSALTADEALSNYDLGAFYHNWAKMIDESSPHGAVGDTIPGGPGAGNSAAGSSADASWASVFPSVVWGLLKYNGDTTVGQFWPGLTRFIDNEWDHLGTPPDISKIFAQFGDWVPPPSGQGFSGDSKVPTQFSAGFSFVNDMSHVVELSRHVGTAADVEKYTSILAQARTLFHNKWFDADKKYYATGQQTAQVLALQAGVVPADMVSSVVGQLVHDIVNVRSNHTTCGIIGWRWELDILSQHGYADVAYALITQTTYPSYGYEILNEDEPATTIWELWNSDVSGPSMNSRDHIMFGGPGKWMYSYVGGIDQTDSSIGYEHVVLQPPATLIEQAIAQGSTPPANSTTSPALRFATASKRTLRGTIELQWALPAPNTNNNATCAEGEEGDHLNLACTGSTIAAVTFASYGTPTGSCSTGGFAKSSCSSNMSQTIVEKCCVGKPTCDISCSQDTCVCAGGATTSVADPCYQTKKTLAVTVKCASAPPSAGPQLTMTAMVPPGSDSQLFVPLLGASAQDVTITESGATVFAKGSFIPNAAPGVTAAAVVGESIVVHHGSGAYTFVRSG